jgi:hypothetical protein
MIKISPAAADDELAQRYADYSAECYAILREPNVWSAIERVAAKLMERGKLSAAEALEAIGGDAAKLHRQASVFSAVSPSDFRARWPKCSSKRCPLWRLVSTW